MLLEVAAALVLFGAVAGQVALAPLGLAAAILVAAATVRRQGLPLPEHSAAVLAMRRRQRRAASAPAGLLGPLLAPLAECDPALRTYDLTGRGGRSVGMVGDGTFLTTVLVVRAEDETLRSARSLPLGPLFDALVVEDVRLASVQVVQHVRPAPAPRVPPRPTSSDILRPRSPMPSSRITWVALRLDPELCPAAVLARGGGVRGAQRAVLRAADHLASRLVGAGFDAAVLDREELIAALAASACLGAADAAPAGSGRRRTVEHSRAWHCDGLRHATYGLGNAPAATRAVAALTSAPATVCSFALTLARGPGGAPVVGGYLRITADGDRALATACGEFEAAAHRDEVELARLDHEQLPGLLATLPLGGTC
ncbi:type VII secretion protein EccE [Streptomyces sp. NRRL F-5123]|uniref:type VII secretion protein EccE n=1 Tax=Streptomyces sp. NRRL F-5123 TaxID=1463856 RepID=UPI0004E1A5EB|nr:type VII secretion protein EccE [Streptomyces sp. NRRL F-5123]